jgi:hypothetical protein
MKKAWLGSLAVFYISKAFGYAARNQWKIVDMLPVSQENRYHLLISAH